MAAHDPPAPNPERRRFLARWVRASLAAAAACLVGYRFHDPTGPAARPPEATGVRLADFSVPGTAGRMSIVRGSERAKTLPRALKAVGGLGTYVKKGDRVVLKVNAAFASPPLMGATSHPELVGAMVRMCLQAGAARVTVTDNPINDPASCFALTGIAAAARSAGARVLLPRSDHFRAYTLPGGRLIRNWPLLYEPFRDADKVIGMAPVKDHHRSGASLSMKNWYGLLGGRRNVFHQQVHTIIAELAAMLRPTLVVLDGTVSMMSNGPTGGSLSDLKETRTLIVSTDQVAADACGAELLERAPGSLPFLSHAETAGLGRSDFRTLTPTVIDVS